MSWQWGNDHGKECPPHQANDNGATSIKYHSNSVKAQCKRLLEALQNAGSQGITTIRAREQLDILMPASRVHALRHRFQMNIQMEMVNDIDAQGNSHKVAKYTLEPGALEK